MEQGDGREVAARVEEEGDRRIGKRERGKPGKEGERVVRAKRVKERG